MATRTTKGSTTKKAAAATVQEAPKQLIPGFRDRAKSRSESNERALLESGAFSRSDFEEFKKDLIDAYKKVSGTSGPVINMNPDALLGFLKDGTYKSFGASGITGGTPDVEYRRIYSSRVYGYEKLEDAEKYGLIPVSEVDAKSPILELPFYKRPGARYGKLAVHLKSSVGNRTTMNVLDSGHQWGSEKEWSTRRFGWLHPVPYRVDKPEDFVGCLMASPTANEIAAVSEFSPRRETFLADIRSRNLNILLLLRGFDLCNYVEAHIHGQISVEDIDFVEYEGPAVVSEPSWKGVLSAGKGIKFADITKA